MVHHRVRIVRIIAAILSFALSTQAAGAQLVNCMQHQHRAHAAASVANHNGGSHNRSSSISGCDQNMLCVTAGAMPVIAVRPIGFASIEQSFFISADVLRARALCPDPPPPRI